MLTGSKLAPRSPGIPPLTEAQVEALYAVDLVAKKNSFVMTIEPGDFQFINNLAVLHARDAFVDGPLARRHLVRLWLRNEDKAWSTPPQLQYAWDRVFGDGPEAADLWAFEPPVDPDLETSNNPARGRKPGESRDACLTAT